MLYTTTRNNRDAYTTHRALHENIAPDGGRYVPFRFPEYSIDNIRSMYAKSINENIADLLNAFFASRLSGWDVDFCVGRNAVRLTAVGHKITVAELWHNPGSNFDYIVQSLYSKITETTDCLPSEWFAIAVRIALYFAIYCERCACGQIADADVIDVSVPDDQGISLMAACYAKRMGLPIGTIICTSVDTAILWDLIHKNELAATGIDVTMQLTIERYLLQLGGIETVSAWRDAQRMHTIFRIPHDEENPLKHDAYCIVTGLQRCDQTINSVFRSNSYLIDPLAAVCFAGLQDYRTQSAASRTALIFAEHSPLVYAKRIAAVTGVSEDKISQYIDI